MKPLISLAAIGALCAVLLTGTHSCTRDAIRANRDAHAWRVAFDLTGTRFPTENLRWNGDRLDLPNGFALRRASVDGYAGTIELLAAFKPGDNGAGTELPAAFKPGDDGAGTLAGVRVTQHQETPGLGDFIDTVRSPWILQFSKRSPEQVDAVTGATITSEAVKRGVSALLAPAGEPLQPGDTGLQPAPKPSPLPLPLPLRSPSPAPAPSPAPSDDDPPRRQQWRSPPGERP